MKKSNVSVLCSGIIFLGALLTVFFWRYEIPLAILLAVLAAAKHTLYPIKNELLWFCFVAVVGPVLENVIIFSGAWNYPQHSLLYVPYWLPMLWGLCATAAVPIYLNSFAKK